MPASSLSRTGASEGGPGSDVIVLAAGITLRADERLSVLIGSLGFPRAPAHDGALVCTTREPTGRSAHLEFPPNFPNAPSNGLEIVCDSGLQQSEWPTSLLLNCCIAATWLRGGLLLHSAGFVGPDGKAVIALAASGGGKSTLTDLASSFDTLSDETVGALVGSGAVAFATTFRSASKRLPRIASAQLAALLLLKKSSDARVEPASPSEIARHIFLQAYRPPAVLADRKAVLQRASQLAKSVPGFRFCFPKSSSADDLMRRLFDERLLDAHT